MASTADNKDQTHPQEKKDKEIVDRLLRENPNPYNYAELARLRIRYCDFPGARELQKNLDATHKGKMIGLRMTYSNFDGGLLP
jgi:hypothetical protein